MSVGITVTTTIRMRLERLGVLTWDALRERVAGTVCAWADLSGFHLAPAADLPSAIPAATHLWAWNDRQVVRARIDVDRVLAAALHHAPAVDGGEGGLVRVRVRPGRIWAPGDLQVGRPDVALPELAFELLEVTGAGPVTFVRATPGGGT